MLDDLINKRRSYRSLKKCIITKEDILMLANAASLAPSCYNNQPWRFLFATDDDKLKKMFNTLSEGNNWAFDASAVIAVLAKKEDDCILPDKREYYQFDCGMAVGFMLLKATELGLVLHPIAGYNPIAVKEAFNITESYEVITLLIAGEKDENIKPYFKDYQIEAENKRPARRDVKDFVFINTF